MNITRTIFTRNEVKLIEFDKHKLERDAKHTFIKVCFPFRDNCKYTTSYFQDLPPTKNGTENYNIVKCLIRAELKLSKILYLYYTKTLLYYIPFLSQLGGYVSQSRSSPVQTLVQHTYNRYRYSYPNLL